MCWRWGLVVAMVLAPQTLFAQVERAAAQSRSTAPSADQDGPAGRGEGGRTTPAPGSGEDAEWAAEDPRLSDAAEVDRIIELYMAGQYEACTEQLGAFLDPASPDRFRDASAIERGRLYFASCALLSGRRDEARAALRAALEANPLMPAPDSLTFPPPLVSLFSEVRGEVEQLITKKEAEQIAELEREKAIAEQRAEEQHQRERELLELATTQPVLVQSKRIIAYLPFGAGQYQNGNPKLGNVFLVSELVLVGTLGTAATIAADLDRQRIALIPDRPVPGEFNPIRDAATVTTITAGSLLLAVMGLGVLEANLNYVPERQVGTRRRELPEHLRPPADPEEEPAPDFRIVPTAGVGPTGFQLGLVGRF